MSPLDAAGVHHLLQGRHGHRRPDRPGHGGRPPQFQSTGGRGPPPSVACGVHVLRDRAGAPGRWRASTQYSGRSMGDSHRHLEITEEEWGAFMDDLQQTMNKFDVPPPEQEELRRSSSQPTTPSSYHRSNRRHTDPRLEETYHRQRTDPKERDDRRSSRFVVAVPNILDSFTKTLTVQPNSYRIAAENACNATQFNLSWQKCRSTDTTCAWRVSRKFGRLF